MRAKKALLKPSGQGKPQPIEKARETDVVVDAESQRSAENERWIEDMAVLRRAAGELAQKRMATRSTVPKAGPPDNSFRSKPFGFSSKLQRNEEVRTLYQSNPERAVVAARERGLGVDAESQKSADNGRWIEDMSILRRVAEDLTQKRFPTKSTVPMAGPPDNSFRSLHEPFGYSSKPQRNEEVRALYHSNPERVASFLKIALHESSPEQRQNIGAELLDSGLVDEAINNLTGAKDKESYSAFSLLYLAAKSGVIHPLVTVIERHPSVELRLKLIRLLVSSGVPEVLPAFRRLAVSKALSFELRPAIVDGINQLNIQMRETAAWTARSQNLERIWDLGFALAVTESHPKFNADQIQPFPFA